MNPAAARIPSSSPPSYHSSLPSATSSTTIHPRNIHNQQPKIVGSIPANAPSRPPSCLPPSYGQDYQPPNYNQVVLDDQRVAHQPEIPSYPHPQIPLGYHAAPPELQLQQQPAGFHAWTPPGSHPPPPHLQQQVQSFNSPQSPPRVQPSLSLLQQQLPSITQLQHEQPNMSQPTFFITSPYNYPYGATATAMLNGAHTQSIVVPHPSAAGYQYVAYSQYYYPAPAYYYSSVPAYQIPNSWAPQYWYRA